MQQAQYVPGTTRLKDTELVVPVATGTVASHLGKKASEFQSHRWTCYVRSPTQVGGGGGNGGGGGDLSLVLRAVTFALHPSFPDHVRTVEAPGPFELTETGWGEFDIGVTLHFSPDSAERDVQLTQRLRLYSDDDPTGARSVTVPVVTETVDELVFSEPQAAFLGRVAAASGRRPDGSIGPLPPAAALSAVQAHFPAPDEARDMAPLQEARRRVAVIAASLRNQAAAMAALAAAGG